MRRGFVSILWGDFLAENKKTCEDLKKEFNFDFSLSIGNPIAIRRSKIKDNIINYSKQPYSKDSTIYVFGKENFEIITDLGINAVLLQDKPYKYHPIRGVYLHKLDAYKRVMEDFDEVVLLDFDMIQTKPLPNDFWDILGQKEILQTSIHQYKNPRLTHRPKKPNKWISSGAFVYVRDKSIPNRLWEINQSNANKWSCEPALSILTDEISSGWRNIDYYWEKFEPHFYTSKRTPFRNQETYPKQTCFFHGHFTNRPKAPKWVKEIE